MAATSEDMEPPNAATLEILKKKHPATPPDRRAFPPQTATLTSMELSAEQVREGIMGFSPGSAGGLSGLRPQHLRDCVSSGEAGSRALRAITNLCNVILDGAVPDSVRPILAGAKLLAFAKKDGGVRPIAVGETLRRLPAKCAFKVASRRLTSVLYPLQLGAGTSNGAEAAVHAARHFISTAADETVFLKLDFANAVNTLRRDVIADALLKNAPELYAFYCACYENSSLLFYGENLIDSSEGFQQGDPRASLGFCRCLQPILTQLKSPFKPCYLDDVSEGGPWKTVLQDLKTFQEKASMIGLQLNGSKSEITVFGTQYEDIVGHFRTVCPEIKQVLPQDLSLLGSPLGTCSTEDALRQKIDSLKLLCTRTAQLPAHQAFFLLKNCFAVPRLLYTLRTSPCYREYELLAELDRLMKDTFEKLANVYLSADLWSQATLPITMGGFGLQAPKDIAAPAYISSVISCTLAIEDILGHSLSEPGLDDAVQHWKSLVTGGVVPPIGIGRQKAWYTEVAKNKQARLVSDVTSELQHARLLGSSAPGSGDWIKALPSHPLGLCLTDEQFRVACALRLGAPVSYAHKCVCGAECDRFGNHALVCRKIKSRFIRHQLGNDVIREAIKSAGIHSTLEPVGVMRNDGRRPDGATTTPWSRGKSLAWDFTCPHRLAASHLRTACREGATVATESEAIKRSRYADIPSCYIFEPVAVETLGGIGESTWLLLKEIGKRLERQTGEKRSFSFLRQRLNVAVQRGNAACILESTTFDY